MGLIGILRPIERKPMRIAAVDIQFPYISRTVLLGSIHGDADATGIG